MDFWRMLMWAYLTFMVIMNIIIYVQFFHSYVYSYVYRKVKSSPRRATLATSGAVPGTVPDYSYEKYIALANLPRAYESMFNNFNRIPLYLAGPRPLDNEFAGIRPDKIAYMPWYGWGLAYGNWARQRYRLSMDIKTFESYLTPDNINNLKDRFSYIPPTGGN